MTKADLNNTLTKEVLKSEKDIVEEQKDLRLKKRIHRITFIITVIVGGFVCCLSAQRYFNWMLQTVIDRTDVHISEIPFPAVTLCPIMDVYYLREKSEHKEFLRSLEKVVPNDDFNDQGRIALGYIDEEDILDKISFKCEDFFVECSWHRIKRNCCSLFRIMPYGNKICYAFNSLMVEDPDPTWPWSESFSGRRSGLRVIINTNASEAMLPKIVAMIHYPEEDLSTNSLYLQGEVHITLDALKFHADAEIRQLRPDFRRCYFSDEIIKYKKCTLKCWKDCRTAYIERVCHCTPRNIIPKMKRHKIYCNSTHLECIFQHRGAFTSSGNILEKNQTDDVTNLVDCKCFPNCNYVQYKTYIRYDMETCNKVANNSLIDVDVHFLRDTIFSYRTGMVYDMLDLVVALCSIIALFLGISVISVVKAIQDYFTKRRKAKTLQNNK